MQLAGNSAPNPPSTALGAAIGADALALGCIVLAIIALAAVVGIIRARGETRTAYRSVRARGDLMHEFLQTVRMAETIAGIGIWQYDANAGTQQWSDGLKRLFGIEGDEDFVEGDAETLLFANGVDLVEQVTRRCAQTGPYTLRFDLVGFDGVARALSIDACNLMGPDQKVERVVAVVRDATKQVQRERELLSMRKEAIAEAHQARILAHTDPLTGLANRRRVMAELDRKVMDARVTQKPLVLAVFDIDHFKSVNDTYGHPEGDKVLHRVAQLARSQARDRDVIGRVGGEEFVWIIEDASDGMARAMSERLRQVVARGSAVGLVPAITISVGYTTLMPDDTALSMFARADGALYDAKNSGRDTVKMAA